MIEAYNGVHTCARIFTVSQLDRGREKDYRSRKSERDTRVGNRGKGHGGGGGR